MTNFDFYRKLEQILYLTFFFIYFVYMQSKSCAVFIKNVWGTLYFICNINIKTMSSLKVLYNPKMSGQCYTIIYEYL